MKNNGVGWWWEVGSQSNNRVHFVRRRPYVDSSFKVIFKDEMISYLNYSSTSSSMHSSVIQSISLYSVHYGQSAASGKRDGIKLCC